MCRETQPYGRQILVDRRELGVTVRKRVLVTLSSVCLSPHSGRCLVVVTGPGDCKNSTKKTLAFRERYTILLNVKEQKILHR